MPQNNYIYRNDILKVALIGNVITITGSLPMANVTNSKYAQQKNWISIQIKKIVYN